MTTPINSKICDLDLHLNKWESVKQSNTIKSKKIISLTDNIRKNALEAFEEYKQMGESTREAAKLTLNKVSKYIYEVKKLLNSSTKSALLMKMKLPDKEKINAKLDQLTEDMNDIAFSDLFIDHYTSISPAFAPISQFVEKIIQSIKNRIMSKIFAATTTIKTARINGEFKSIQSKIAQNENQIQTLDSELKILNSKTGNSTAENSSAVKNLEAKRASLIELQQDLAAKRTKLQDSIQKLDQDKKKGKQTRSLLKILGAEEVKIDLPKENTSLNGMYLSCDEFKKKLSEIGAQTCSIQANPIGNAGKNSVRFSAISVSKDADQSQILKSLNSIGAFANSESDGIGWVKIKYRDRILFIPDDQINLKPDVNGFIDMKKWELNPYNNKDLDTSQPSSGGTVILTTGMSGVYEMHKKELLAFLIRGMNVMTINFRGCGESTGVPSENGFKRDLEAAYQYIKQNHPIADDKIVVKGLCMSGGPCTYLVSKHPNLNLFLDQTYADFRDVVVQGADIELQKYKKSLNTSIFNALSKWVLKHTESLVHIMIKGLAPAWKISEEIRSARGHIAMLLTTNDKLMKLDRDLSRNYEAVLKSNKTKSTSILAIEGEHADSWLYPQKINPYTFVDEKKAEELAEKTLKDVSHQGMNLTDNDPFDHYQDYRGKSAQNDLFDTYQSIKAFISDEKPSAIALNDRIHKISQEKAPYLRAITLNYLLKTFIIKPEFLIEGMASKGHFFGRTQMDHFLKQADLSDPRFFSLH